MKSRDIVPIGVAGLFVLLLSPRLICVTDEEAASRAEPVDFVGSCARFSFCRRPSVRCAGPCVVFVVGAGSAASCFARWIYVTDEEAASRACLMVCVWEDRIKLLWRFEHGTLYGSIENSSVDY